MGRLRRITKGVEQLGGSLDDAESGDRSLFGGQLFAGLLLKMQSLAVDCVEFCFER